ncbi:MAG: hypothetical protein QXD64_07195, partial [Thermoplasmata archaeon]
GSFVWMNVYTSDVRNGDEPPWAPLARALAPIQVYEDINQEFPTSIFFDGDRDMSNNGLPATWPGGGTNRRWHSDDAINNALAKSNMSGMKYYAKSLEEKKSITTVYLQGFQKDNLLGIQYWFYYPFHDDPGLDPHPHDWWYFWVVYDVSAKKPVKVIYDFHHNLRACDFTDSGRVKREGLHVYTYHDAGGHRTLWDAGEQPSYWDLVCLSRGWSLADVYEGRGYPIYTTRDVLAGDKLFGTMIEYLKHQGTIATWRNENSDWNEGVTLRVEGFSHWVWVWKVENTLQSDPENIRALGYVQKVVRVCFTGDNMYRDAYGDLWPLGLYDGQGNQKINFYLPWTVNYIYSHGTMISSTIMVWFWQQYTTYNFFTMHPDIYTRYYDGSP